MAKGYEDPVALEAFAIFTEVESVKGWGITKFLELSNACTSVKSWVAHYPEPLCSELREWTSEAVKDYFDYYELDAWQGRANEEVFKVSGIGHTDYLHAPDRGVYVHTLTAIGPPSTHGIRVGRLGHDISLDPGDFVILPPDFPYEVSLLGPGDEPSYFLRQFLMQQ